MKETNEMQKRKVFENSHNSKNVNTKKILSMKVTADEYVHDSKALPELVDGILKSDKTVGKIFADDGAYDSNDIFKYLVDMGILPCIKVQNNSRVRWKKVTFFRNLSVLVQKKDLQEWKNNLRYGQLWIAKETVFSCLKRRLGDVYSVKLKNMIQQEMIWKASLYNKIISI